MSIQGAEAPLVQASEVDRAFAESLETTGETYQGTQRLARGNLGERLATDALVADGHTIIFFKPDIQGTNQGGIDIVTLRDGQVFFVDNKALTRSGNVSSVSALTTNLGQNVQAVRADLRTSLARSDLSQAERQVFQEALSAIDAGRVRCAVTNANLTRDDRVLSGVTEGLEGQGIEFIDVFRSLVYGPRRR